jgi:hypothetical protein
MPKMPRRTSTYLHNSMHHQAQCRAFYHLHCHDIRALVLEELTSVLRARGPAGGSPCESRSSTTRPDLARSNQTSTW